MADGGTSISDASGGTGNLAADSGDDHDRNNNNHNNNNNGNNNNGNNNRNKNRNNWSAESLQSFELRLLQTEYRQRRQCRGGDILRRRWRRLH